MLSNRGIFSWWCEDFRSRFPSCVCLLFSGPLACVCVRVGWVLSPYIFPLISGAMIGVASVAGISPICVIVVLVDCEGVYVL